MDTCIFCQIIDGSAPSHKIWENEDFIAFLDINPVSPGHTLVVPKFHVDHVFDVPEPLYSELFQITKNLAPLLQRAMQTVRVGVVIEGFGVPHAHVHLVPIDTALELDPNRARPANSAELIVMAKKIKSELSVSIFFGS